MQSQRRMTILVSTIVGVAVVSLGLSALVYFRSLADLREAAKMHVDAVAVLVERINVLGETITRAEKTQAEIAATATNSAEGFVALTATLTEQTNTLAEAASMAPQIASAIQSHIDTGLEATKTDMATKIDELNLSVSQMIAGAASSSTGNAPGLATVLDELRTGQKTMIAKLASLSESPKSNTPKTARQIRPAVRPQADAAENTLKFP